MARMDRPGMVVAPQPEAVEAGVEALRAGGNAVDAALACAFVQTVIDPLMCGIAGFGSMAVHFPGQEGIHEYIDFHAPAPQAATPTMWQGRIEGEARDGWGFRLRGRINELGYQAVCVPATLAGLWEAHRSHGRMSWGDLIEPAVRAASDGWIVRPAVYEYWKAEGDLGRAASIDRLAYSGSGRTLYCRPDGSPKRVGERIRNPDYAQTLVKIAKRGAQDFYTGELAALMIQDFAANGGFFIERDLAEYRPARRKPLESTYRDYRIKTNSPPGGGTMLLEMLNIVEHFDLEALRHNSPDYIATVAEAMKLATADKDRWVGDPRFVDVPVDRLTSKSYAGDLARAIQTGRRASIARLPWAPAPDTTHVSVVDCEGGCVSLTHSLGLPSGVITPGLGFVYNGCMHAFDPRPGRAASIAPGKTRFSGIAPSIAFRGEDPVLVIGATGGTQIPMGLLQVIINVIDFKMTMQEAVAAPRFSATSNAIDIVNRIPRSVGRSLEARGYEVVRRPSGFGIAWIQGIKSAYGRLEGGSDPGRDGMAMATDEY